MKTLRVVVIAALIAVAGAQFVPLLYAASNSTKFPTGRVMLTDYGQTLPNVAADISTTDTYIFQLVLTNKTGGAVSVTIQDRQGSPKYLLNAAAIAANTTYVVAFPEGVLMKSGVNWVASSANAIDAFISARKL